MKIMRHQASDAFKLLISVILAALILSLIISLGKEIHKNYSRSVLFPTIKKSITGAG